MHRHLFRDAYRDLTSFDVEIKKAKLEEQFEVNISPAFFMCM